MVLIAVPGIGSLLVGQGLTHQVVGDGALALCVLASNIAFYIAARQTGKPPHYYFVLAGVLLALDILCITFFIYTKGGIESRSLLLYVVPILMSSVVFDRTAIYKTTLFVLVCYNGLILADHLHVIQALSELTPQLSDSSDYVLNSSVFMSTLVFSVAFVADFISRLLAHEHTLALRNLESLSRAQAIAHLGSWEYHIRSGKAVWSAEMYRMFGVRRSQEPLGPETFIAAMHPDDQPRLRRALRRAMTRKVSFGVNFRFVQGSVTKYIHADVRSVTDARGTVTDIFGMMRDVTETKALEASRSDFVSLASHQLRTPATVAKQYLALLLDGYAGSLTKSQLSFVKKAYEGNEHQIQLVNDLLGVLQLESGNLVLQRTRTDVVALVRAAAAVYAPRRKNAKHTLEVVCRRSSVHALIDGEQVRKAVQNVIDNAIRYSPAGTTVRVSVTQNRGLVRIRVTDRGVGVAKKDIARMFEKFTRLDNRLSAKAGGSGLGLYHTAKVIDLHHGSIEVRSTVGKGTTITMCLPLR